jgi:soluble lytic murein transglycosylase-like protein
MLLAQQRFRQVPHALVALLTVGLLVVLFPAPTKSDFDGQPRYNRQEIRRAIIFYSKRYRLDPALLRAVIKVESDFRPHVVSRKGAVGLMQLTPDMAATLRVADIHDPIQNIRGGAKQLRHLLNLYHDDLPLTLAAYNAGVHRVKDHRVPRIRETRAYVRKVLKYYHRYQPQQLPGRYDVRKPQIADSILREARSSLG